MIVLDTRIWIWRVHGDAKLSQTIFEFIKQEEANSHGVSAVSCWEVAKLVERESWQLLESSIAAS